MTSTEPMDRVPVVYIASPTGIISNASSQILAAGGIPLVGWLATGLFGTVAAHAYLPKAVVARTDCMFVYGFNPEDASPEIDAATELGIPVFRGWAELVDFISNFGLED